MNDVTAIGRPLAWLLTVALLVGCGDLNTDYGPATGRTGRVSLNGFGAFRGTFDRFGFRTRDLNRLGDRALPNDVIVWTPQTLDSIDPTVGDWFERWLKQGDRTLIYVVPDSGSEAEYWIEAGRLAPPEQKFEYRRRAARSVNERMRWRLNREGTAVEGWFRVEPTTERIPLRTLHGPWADLFDGGPGTREDADAATTGELPSDDSVSDDSVPGVEVRLTPIPDAANRGAGSSGGTAGPRPQSGPTGPASMARFATPRRWVSKTETESERLLESERGDAIIVRITADPWNGSEVIVVGGGSLLTNFALARPEHRELARRLVAEAVGRNRGRGGDTSTDGAEAASGANPRGGEIVPDGASPDRRAGFLTSDWQGVRVSEAKPGVPRASGMELLTVWPLSLVTTHAVMLGVVVCLMLIPVFGRPARFRHRRTNRFGDHLDALAALMNKAGGEPFARARIAAYMRQVRGETAGPWVQPPAPPADAGSVDPGLVDAGLVDPGLVDPGLVDPGLVDAGLVDAGLVDPGLADAGAVRASDDPRSRSDSFTTAPTFRPKPEDETAR